MFLLLTHGANNTQVCNIGTLFHPKPGPRQEVKLSHKSRAGSGVSRGQCYQGLTPVRIDSTFDYNFLKKVNKESMALRVLKHGGKYRIVSCKTMERHYGSAVIKNSPHIITYALFEHSC